MAIEVEDVNKWYSTVLPSDINNVLKQYLSRLIHW